MYSMSARTRASSGGFRAISTRVSMCTRPVWRFDSMRPFWSPLLVAVTVTVSTTAADLAQQAQAILARNCYECHGPDKQKAELRLDTDYERLTRSNVAAITPGRAETSELYRRITPPHGDEEIMPNRGDPLTKAQVEIIRNWINQGAPWAEKTAPAKHWSYVAPVRPARPKIAEGNARWPKNAIDYFVLARL